MSALIRSANFGGKLFSRHSFYIQIGIWSPTRIQANTSRNSSSSSIRRIDTHLRMLDPKSFIRGPLESWSLPRTLQDIDQYGKDRHGDQRANEVEVAILRLLSSRSSTLSSRDINWSHVRLQKAVGLKCV
jgi:hypothetical protein